MSTDLEEQEDELLALQSIFDDREFVRDQSKFSGKIRVCAELPAEFTVILKEGESQREYQISFLPPLLLTFDLPGDYPSSSPPSFALTCRWLTHTQLSALSTRLVELYHETGGAVVLFSWVQFLREDALKFLGICNELQVPDGDDTLQDKHNAAAERERNDPLAPDPQPADNPCGDAVESCKLDIGVPAAVLPSSCTDPPQIEDLLHEGEFSASGPLEENAEGAASLLAQVGDFPQDEDRFLLEISPSQAILSQILIYDASQKQRVFDSSVFDCGVCYLSHLGSECVELSDCGHIFCRACLGEFCKLRIEEGNVRSVTCLEAGCTATPSHAQVMTLVGEELFNRYDRLLLQTSLDCMTDVVYCPRPSCASAVIQETSSSMAMCSACGFAFCVKCKKTYHGTDDCDVKQPKGKYEKESWRYLALPDSKEGRKALFDDYSTATRARRRLLESRYGRHTLLFSLESGLSEDWVEGNSKPCPHCFTKIQKNGGCSRMLCTQCRHGFCWACLTIFTPSNSNAHYDGSCQLFTT